MLVKILNIEVSMTSSSVAYGLTEYKGEISCSLNKYYLLGEDKIIEFFCINKISNRGH